MAPIIKVKLGGDEREYPFEPLDTIGNLKEWLEKSHGITPSSQILYCGFSRLEKENDAELISGFLDISETFCLEFPYSPRLKDETAADKDTWIVKGSKWTSYQALKLPKEREENIPLTGFIGDERTFGVVMHKEGDPPKRVFNVTKYTVPRDATLLLKTVGDNTEVFIKNEDGTESMLTGRLKVWEESKTMKNYVRRGARLVAVELFKVIMGALFDEAFEGCFDGQDEDDVLAGGEDQEPQ